MLQDNGKGFDNEKHQKGAGLHNIKDRALILGATLDISSKIKQGTSVHIHLNK